MHKMADFVFDVPIGKNSSGPVLNTNLSSLVFCFVSCLAAPGQLKTRVNYWEWAGTSVKCVIYLDPQVATL
jgi:hypothetical protein